MFDWRRPRAVEASVTQCTQDRPSRCTRICRHAMWGRRASQPKGPGEIRGTARQHWPAPTPAHRESAIAACSQGNSALAQCLTLCYDWGRNWPSVPLSSTCQLQYTQSAFTEVKGCSKLEAQEARRVSQRGARTWQYLARAQSRVDASVVRKNPTKLPPRTT